MINFISKWAAVKYHESLLRAGRAAGLKLGPFQNRLSDGMVRSSSVGVIRGWCHFLVLCLVVGETGGEYLIQARRGSVWEVFPGLQFYLGQGVTVVFCYTKARKRQI